MKQELNIAAILKDKPKNTKLWSPIFGNCYLNEVIPDKAKTWIEYDGTYYSFDKEGKHFSDGEPMLFPSKKMRDWDKFAWKKGDVLISDNGEHCFFYGWLKDNYEKFEGRYSSDEATYQWRKETNENVIKEFINKVEEIYNGKLNLETLEIEYKTKQVKEHKFQPFDKVLVRNAKDEIWFPRLFAYEGDTYIVCIDGDDYQFCIPYNDSTKHLLGTTKDWEGGEI